MIFFALSSRSQSLEWNVNTFGFADNREYAPAELYSQSILGIRLAPEIGLLADSTHRVRFGGNLLREFGTTGFAGSVDPIIYYNYRHQGASFYIGSFPRLDLLSDYPRAVLNDTLMYYRPNVEGMLFQFKHRIFNEQIWVDWVSRQTLTDREQFMVGLAGDIRSGRFSFSHYLTMFHNAGDMTDNQPVRDNAVLLAKGGINLSDKTFLDSLSFNAGVLVSFDRLRGAYDWRTPKGLIVDVNLVYKSWFLNNTYYKGDEHDIVYGDRFYTKDRYDRLDLGWKPLRKNNLEGFLMLSLHFTPGAMSNQQMLLLRYNLGGLTNFGKKNHF